MAHRPGYFKGVENFSDGVRVFFKWGFFIMVEAILGWLKLLQGVMFFVFL